MKPSVNINEVAEINPRFSNSSTHDKTQLVSFLPMAGVSEDGYIAKIEERKLGEVIKGYTYFQEGDVLVAKITPCFENGKAALAVNLPHTIGFGSTEFHVLRPGLGLESSYLFYMIRCSAFRFAGMKNMTGTAGQKRLPVSFFSRYKIPIPSLPDQKRIAAILDKAYLIRRKRQKAIQLANEFLRSVFLDTFGDPATNPKGWNCKQLKCFGKITTGNTPPRKEPDNYGDAIEWIKSDNINTPYHFLTKAEEMLSIKGEKIGRIVPANSILVTCIAGSPSCIGNAALADKEVAFNQQINAITLFENINVFFLYVQILLAKKLIQAASTKSMKGLVSKKKFEEIIFLNPPSRLQNQFGEFFQKWLKSNEKLNANYRESNNLFFSLTQRAFRGEL